MLLQRAVMHLSGILKSDKSGFKSRVPKPMSRLTSNRERLVRMVDQNGGKFECL